MRHQACRSSNFIVYAWPHSATPIGTSNLQPEVMKLEFLHCNFCPWRQRLFCTRPRTENYRYDKVQLRSQSFQKSLSTPAYYIWDGNSLNPCCQSLSLRASLLVTDRAGCKTVINGTLLFFVAWRNQFPDFMNELVSEYLDQEIHVELGQIRAIWANDSRRGSGVVVMSTFGKSRFEAMLTVLHFCHPLQKCFSDREVHRLRRLHNC